MLLSLVIHLDDKQVTPARRGRAAGYVLDSAARDDLIDAVQDVINGHGYVTPSLPVGHDRLRGSLHGAGVSHLTKREREMLSLISEGKAEKEIAVVLGISIKTVGFHRKNLKEKLSVKTTTELTRYALEQGIFGPSAFVDLCPSPSLPEIAAPTTDVAGKYERETWDTVSQFVEGRINVAECVHALNAALSLAIRFAIPLHLPLIRTAMRANTERILTELGRRHPERRLLFLV